MKYYCIKLKGKDVYIGRNKNGTYYLTKDIRCVMKYHEDKKVKNIMQSMPKSLKNVGNYEMYEFEDEEEDEEDIVVKPKENENFKLSVTNNNTELKELKSEIDSFTQRLSDMVGDKKELLNQLSQVNLEICDLLHYIEFYNFSACDGYKLAKRIQIARDKRRIIKNKLRVIESMNSESCMGLINGKLYDKINKIDHQTYTPRVLTELFKNGKNVRNVTYERTTKAN